MSSKRLPSPTRDTILSSSRSSAFSSSSMSISSSMPVALPRRSRHNNRKLTKLPLELNISTESGDDGLDTNIVQTRKTRPNPTSHRSQRSSRDIFNASLHSNRSKKTHISHSRIDYDIYRKEPDQLPVDTDRRIPVVEWKKIRSVPETERVDETIDITAPVDLNKCLTCSTETAILKLLPCLHSFCQPCLDLKINEYPSRSWFRCELCSQQVHTPSNGVGGFEDNVYFKFSELSVSDYETCSVCSTGALRCRCTVCKLNLCNECVVKHKSTETDHYIVNLSKEMVGKSSTGIVCEEHSPFTLELFCLTCSEAICGRCAIHKHRNHIAEHIKMTAIDRRSDLKAELNGSLAKRAVKDIHEYVKACKKEKVNVQNDVQNAVQSIQIHIQALKDELDEFGKSMIKDLVDKEVIFIRKLETNIEDAEKRDKATFASVETLKHMIDRFRDLELVDRYKDLHKVIVDVKRFGKPPPATGIRFRYKPLVNTIGPAIGRLRIDAFLNKPVQYVELGSLQFNKNITCILPIDHTKAWVGFRKYIQICGKDGTHGLRVDCGDSVSAIDSNLNGSVYIACISCVKVLTNKFSTKYLFNVPHEPSDMKINAKELFIISFKDAKRVATFDSKGKAIHEFDIRHFGFRFGIRIHEPWKLAISENEDIYLTDYSSETIGVFDEQCEIKHAFETQVFRHASLCCDRGLLFVADYKRDGIHVYSQEGNLLQTCQTPGINAPCSITVDKAGDLWLGAWNGLVKIYTAR